MEPYCIDDHGSWKSEIMYKMNGENVSIHITDKLEETI